MPFYSQNKAIPNEILDGIFCKEDLLDSEQSSKTHCTSRVKDECGKEENNVSSKSSNTCNQCCFCRHLETHKNINSKWYYLINFILLKLNKKKFYKILGKILKYLTTKLDLTWLELTLTENWLNDSELSASLTFSGTFLLPPWTWTDPHRPVGTFTWGEHSPNDACWWLTSTENTFLKWIQNWWWSLEFIELFSQLGSIALWQTV